MNFGFIGNFGHRLSLARSLPPRLVLAKLAKRLPWANRRAVRVAEIIHSPNDLQPDRLVGFFRKQEAFLRENAGWRDIDFDGRHVIEVGPGPLAGWGPMAIFRGAARVHGIDPDWIDGAFGDPSVEAAYLRPHHAALSSAFGPLMPYDEFHRRVRERLTVEASGLTQAAPGFRADIVLSNSCLEHIDDLEDALAALRRHCAPGARFMHLVNFGNHRNRAAPFERMYDVSPKEYHLKYGRHINLLRADDVQRAFAGAGLEAEMHVVDRLTPQMSLHAHWAENYAPEILAIRTALFVGPALDGGAG